MKFAYLVEPPFNYHTCDGQITGCDVERARHICKTLNDVAFAPIETDFASLLDGLQAGYWRMTTGLFVTPEREKHVLFSRPIWALPDGLLVAEGNPLALTGYGSVAQSDACLLGVIDGQVQHDSALEHGVNPSQIRVFSTYQEAANAVLCGNIHAYASVERAHTGFLERHPDWRLHVTRVPTDEKAPAIGAFAFAKDDVLFRDLVNAVLAPYLASLEHQSMMMNFGFSRTDIELLHSRVG